MHVCTQLAHAHYTVTGHTGQEMVVCNYEERSSSICQPNQDNLLQKFSEVNTEPGSSLQVCQEAWLPREL